MGRVPESVDTCNHRYTNGSREPSSAAQYITILERHDCDASFVRLRGSAPSEKIRARLDDGGLYGELQCPTEGQKLCSAHSRELLSL